MTALPKDFISVADLSRSQIDDLFRLAADLKRRPGDYRRRLDGRALALIFQKPSTRTRVSFDVGIGQLGGRALYMSPLEMQLGRGETVEDTARVLSGYVDAVVARLFAHADIVTLSAAASVPVINALTDDLHPCQALSDFFTLGEIFGDLRSVGLAYVGDGNNMAQSLLIAAAVLGSSIAIATPSGYEVDPTYARLADDLARESGAEILHTHDPVAATAGRQAVYTDVWTSMGQEEENDQRQVDFHDFQVDARLLAAADDAAIFLHCLPLHRGEEVSAEVADGAQSRIWLQAANRLHVQKALLVTLLDRPQAAIDAE